MTAHSNSRQAKFLNSLAAVGCDVEKLTPLSPGHELPEKLLKYISGGKTGFTRSQSGEGKEFIKSNFYRALHH